MTGTLALAGEERQHVTIEPKEGGWTVTELLQLLTEHSGDTFLFDPDDLRDEIFEFVGVQSVPRDQLFAWMQSVLSFQKIILVPGRIEGHEVWKALKFRDIPCRPITLTEEELPAWKDREEVFVLLMTRLDHADPKEIAEILAELVGDSSCSFIDMPKTRMLLGYGRIRDLRHVVDLIHALDVPSPETLREIERLERFLAEAKTEAAAKHLIEQIRRLREGGP